LNVTDQINARRTWKDAFFQTPGPRSPGAFASLAAKGFCMGAADIVPGVSGGTMALVMGIYLDLLEAIRSADAVFFKRLFLADFKGALAGLRLRFLLPLFLGIVLALVSLAGVIHYFLERFPVYVWGFFSGLIAASAAVVLKQVKKWAGGAAVMFPAGLALAFVIAGLAPVSTSNQPPFIFLAGFVAVCAMILPGISGAFILLLLGKYEFITGTLRNPFSSENLWVIAVFVSGCLCGLFVFSRVLKFLIERYRDASHAFLAGVIAGSMTKSQIVESLAAALDGVKGAISGDWGPQNVWVPALLATGFLFVIFLERASEKKTSTLSSI
jgi:putative membrane protein